MKADIFLKKYFGVPRGALEKCFEEDSDWTLVIKLHTYIEASLNLLIVQHLGDDRLEEVIGYLDVSDRRRGKLAFIKALDLLPSEYRTFIHRFSEIRNSLAHDVRNTHFDLKIHIAAMDAKQFKAWADAIAAMRKDLLGSFLGGDSPRQQELLKIEPRYSILHATIAIVYKAYLKRHQVLKSKRRLRLSKSGSK